MKILWFNWKDMEHPLAGGAEVVNEELAKRLVADGHEVQFVVGGFDGSAAETTRDGFAIARVGNRFSVYWHAYKLYKKKLVKEHWDLVIDEMNTIPFFCKFYVKQRNIMFVHQLAREIWFYQMPFPISLIGFLLEPVYLWLLRDREIVTVSESTKRDLMRFGFKPENIYIISEGITLTPVSELESAENIKYKVPTLLSLGAIRPMKRTLETIKGFEYAKNEIPELELIVAGDTSGKYASKVLKYIESSKYRDSIKVLGKVSDEKKMELMRKSFALIVTSVKEGWGLVVTEANSQGTPAVVYNADGLRDSVKHRQTGLVCNKNLPEEIAANVLNLYTIPEFYENVRHRAWEWSKEITFERSYQDFKTLLS